ncbi:glycerol-3-phosphate responsive antiterminator [Bacillus badius]|uniref:Glycerol uptake operon antiterminator regulatory protein n=1 Tax=Bacillus badius TaxID=1455 RepID=A0ABR5AUK9_BACBA|nr:glycerol-3-phosphate responsive antiterminator [Bacillus badius]KIL76309.1 Glycerol-3-phosphate responsive antiterminator (mRNA-binding) [Bacillus badius]KIL78427.1 Glycerol-3-phosphate responsive antiterminator [Bacillus badius]MED4716083.1 glycerol-3-phosphate responsive antiterminator [Bacillus badius]
MKHIHALPILKERLQTHKMVAAVKEPKYIEKAIKYKDNLSAVLLMTGTILTVKKYVDFIQSHDLPVILHVEKIGGLEMDRDGVEFVKRNVQPHAIVTTRNGIIKKAKSSGLAVVQRIFLIDTEVYTNLIKDVKHIQSDIIEIMPCRAPDFLSRISKVSPVPTITGGLLNSPEHAKQALENGALAVTTSNPDMWKLNLNEL